MLFYGWEKRCLDEKGRLKLPKSIRQRLGPEVVIIKKGKKLFIYPGWYKAIFKPSRIFLGIFDKEGRIKFPLRLIKDFIGKWIILKGRGEYIEISPRNKVNYSEIRVKEAWALHKKGLSVICDADKKEIFLKL